MISIIAPAYNNPEEVKKLLESLRRDVSKDPALEVIVVDDRSRDDSIRKAVETSGFAKYIRMKLNGGPAAARNAGAKAAKNNILLFVDSDVVFNEDTLPRIKNRFNQEVAVSILGGEYDVIPANPSPATRFKALMVRSWCPKEGFVTVFLTRVGAIKKNIFMEMGGFDTKLKTAAVEDYEFARRLMAKGYTIYHDPEITVKHHFPSFREQIRLFFHRSFMWIYVFKKYGKFDNTCTTPLQGITQMCAFLSCLFFAAGLVNIKFMYPAELFLALFIITNLRFFKLAFESDGLVFTILSVFMSLVISCSIVLGAAWGFIYYYICAPLCNRKEPSA